MAEKGEDKEEETVEFITDLISLFFPLALPKQCLSGTKRDIH